jgi:rod shape-determining protein MreD
LGAIPVNWLNTWLVLVAAFLAVFWEAAFNGFRQLFGVQVDLLPPLMVYASLSTGLGTVALLAFCGGLWFDSLSANPLGVTVLPLFLVGLVIYASRELILRDQPFAQMVIGFGASAVVPLIVLLLLLTTGHNPLLGLGTLWQWAVMGVGGAVATPLVFALFDRLNRALLYSRQTQTSFRPDREIRRGRG